MARGGKSKNRKRRYHVLIQQFPGHNIPAILGRFPQQSVEEIAHWIRSTPDAPKKKQTPALAPQPRRQRRRARNDGNAKVTVNQPPEQDADPHEVPPPQKSKLDDLLRDLFMYYKCERNVSKTWLAPEMLTSLCTMFPNLKVGVFYGAFSHNRNLFSTIIACWFIANGLTDDLIKFMKEPNPPKWTRNTMKADLKREKDLDFIPKHFQHLPGVYHGFSLFKETMMTLSKEYPDILKGTRLQQAAFTLEEVDLDNTFTCLVCFIDVHVKNQIKCGKSYSAKRHSFCRQCLKGHAKAASEEMPLSEGAVGLKCMDFDCENPIYLNDVQKFIPKKVKKRIEERMAEENLALSGLKLERCRDCNYAVEIDVGMESALIFKCINCNSIRCRQCSRKWDNNHAQYSCEELDRRERVDRKQRDLEAKMNDVVVRKCHRCHLQFTKTEGCNLVKCRCGAKQCYICRKEVAGYEHFCQHQGTADAPCLRCNSCHLFEDPAKQDNQAMARVRLIEIQRDRPPVQNNVYGVQRAAPRVPAPVQPAPAPQLPAAEEWRRRELAR